MRKDLISIIVPVYNVEKYISICIESILNQTYTNFELILINDGSIDNSGFICKIYSEKDDRIVFFAQENKGVSATRNFGLQCANGKWVTFVDADDFVDEKYLESFNLDEINSADFYIQCEAKDYYSADGQFIKTRQIGYLCEEQLLTPEEYLRRTSYLKKASVGPYAKIYSLDLIKEKNLNFIENSAFCEDLLFSTLYLSFCRTIKIFNVAHYHYRIIEGLNSLSKRSIPSKEYFISFERFIISIPSFLDSFTLKEISPVMEIFVSGCIRGLKSAYESGVKKSDRLYYIEQIKIIYIANAKYWRFMHIKYSFFFWLLKILKPSTLDVFFTPLFKRKINDV